MLTFDYTAVVRSGNVGPVNQLTTPVGWLSALQLTVQSRFTISVIKHFGGVFVLSLCFFENSVGIEAFVIGLSQITSLFSCNYCSLLCSSQLGNTLFYLFSFVHLGFKAYTNSLIRNIANNVVPTLTHTCGFFSIVMTSS